MPFLSLFLLRESTQRQRRDVPRLRRLLAVVRVRQPGHARPRGAAPRPDRGQRRGAPLHRPLLPGRLQGHPQRRRRPALRRRGPDRALAGRHARTSCSSAATSRARACSTCSRRTGSCARPATSTGCSSSARGRRSARRGATSRRAASRRVEFLGRVTDAEKAQLFRTADVFASPATGGESFGIVLLEAMAAGAPIVASDIHGYKGVVRRGREGLLVPPREPKELAPAIAPAARRPGAAGRDGRGRPGARRGVQLAAGDRQGRGLLRLRHPPARGDRLSCPRTSASPIPQAPPRPGQALGIVRTSPAASARPLGQRQPPDPGRVGDHQAGHRRGRSVRIASIGVKQRRVGVAGRPC